MSVARARREPDTSLGSLTFEFCDFVLREKELHKYQPQNSKSPGISSSQWQGMDQNSWRSTSWGVGAVSLSLIYPTTPNEKGEVDL